MVNDPRFTRICRFGTENFVVHLEDKEGETVTFFGYANWKEGSEGREIVFLSYWPYDKEFHEDIVAHVEKLLGI